MWQTFLLINEFVFIDDISNILGLKWYKKTRFRIRICINFGRLDPDPDPGKQKRPTKIEKKP
jgi:hypothetical protein